MQICLNHGIDMSLFDIVTRCMELLINTIVRRSMSARLDQTPPLDAQEQFASQPIGATAAVQSTWHGKQDQK